MNPETNKFERLSVEEIGRLQRHNTPLGESFFQLLRPNGEPVPKHWTILSEGESVVVKDYTFKVAHIGESYLVLEPVGPIIIGKTK